MWTGGSPGITYSSKTTVSMAEYEFGAFKFSRQNIFSKIDTYERAFEQGGPGPVDPKVTCRVLTNHCL